MFRVGAVGGPGSGKTTLNDATIDQLMAEIRLGTNGKGRRHRVK